jgi:hypothetical protein
MGALSVVTATLPCPTGPSGLRALWQTAQYDIAERPAPQRPAFVEPEHAHISAALTAAAVAGTDASATRASPTRTTTNTNFVPTMVSYLISPNRIGEVNTRLQRVTIDFHVQMYWLDRRLAFNESCWSRGDLRLLPTGIGQSQSRSFFTFSEDPRGQLWTPNVVVDNVYTNSVSESYSQEFQITNLGFIIWQYRASYELSCEME